MRDRWSKWREAFGSETDYIIRLWSCFSDPAEQEAFLDSVREKKKTNPKWSIYDDFPPVNDQKEIAKRYSTAILEMLSGRGEKDVG